MQLKLAGYILETGKFHRFLELKNDFGYFGDYIVLAIARDTFSFPPIKFYRDKKDPLNRFNGLFDGRTYGEGRFVLIEIGLDKLDQKKELDQVFVQENALISNACDEVEDYYFLIESWNLRNVLHKTKCLGNLHENPELYEKI